MSKKLSKICYFLMIMLTISLSTFSGVSQESGFDQVHLGPGNEISDINFVIRHMNSSARNDHAEFILGLSETYGNDLELVDPVTSADLESSHAMIFINSDQNASQNEIDVIKKFVESGKGLLFLAKTGNTSKSSQSFVNRFFGTEVIKFTDYQINGTLFDTELPYVIASDFNSPRTPVTQNISKLILPQSLGLSINFTAVKETNVSIKDIYPIIFDNNNTILGIAIELNQFGRMVFLGSKMVFEDDVIFHNNQYSAFITTNNEEFGFNALTWLGRGSGYVNKYSHVINADPLESIDKGFNLEVDVTITDENNNTLTDAEVRLEIEFQKGIVDFSYMNPGTTNHYLGELTTRNTDEGNYVEIRVSVSKRGYLEQSFLLNRVYINKPPSGQALPNVIVMTVFGGGIIVFLFSSYLIWTNFQKMSKDLE